MLSNRLAGGFGWWLHFGLLLASLWLFRTRTHQAARWRGTHCSMAAVGTFTLYYPPISAYLYGRVPARWPWG